MNKEMVANDGAVASGGLCQEDQEELQQQALEIYEQMSVELREN